MMAGIPSSQDRDPESRSLVGLPSSKSFEPIVWMLDDDHELCLLLSRFFGQVTLKFHFFNTVRDFEQALLVSSPAVLVLDQMLPIKSGIDVLRSLRTAGYGFPVLILSAIGAPTVRVEGLEAGANDYLVKPFLCRELELRLKQLLKINSNNLSPTGEFPSLIYCQIGDILFDSNKSILVANGAEVRLTRGETALMRVFCSSGEGLVTRAELLRLSGSLVQNESSRTVDVRVSKLRKRLRELNNDIDLIEVVRGRGYRLSCSVIPLV